MADRPSGPERATLGRFFLLSYLVTLAFCLPYIEAARGGGGLALAFALAVWSTYPLLYLAPALLTTVALRALLKRIRGVTPEVPLAVRLWAVTTTALSLALLAVNARIHGLYGFHVNGFVLNLLTTPGGIESLGAGASTYRTCLLGLLAIVLLQLGLLRLTRLPLARVLRPPRAAWLLAWLVVSAAERVGFGVAHAAAYGPVLAASDAFPLYSRLTFDRLAERLGFEVRQRQRLAADLGDARLDYPLAPLELAKSAHPPNVVWLVAESLRADALADEVMPRTADFARGAQRFTHHLSSGNGTRMGLFGMFYGLYAPYWFPALEARRGPVLLDALTRQGYQFSVHTSARFTYPEFDRTVFADVPEEDLHEWSTGESWERDRALVGGILSSLDGRDPERPFFAFGFFESPHARYAFPPECAVHTPFLEDFDYVTADIEHDIEPIRKRYLNSCRHLDDQLGRLLEGLSARGLLDETIVVITGDHGEEFLEHGHWGHGSSFVAEQTLVPLVLHVPGLPPATVERMTSHLDLPATILPRLGVRNHPADLSLGHDLLGASGRAFSVIGDWSRLCIVTADLKGSFATQGKGLFRTELTDGRDRPAPEGAELPVQVLAEVLEGLARFRVKPSRAPSTRPSSHL